MTKIAKPFLARFAIALTAARAPSGDPRCDRHEGREARGIELEQSHDTGRTDVRNETTDDN